MEEKKGLRKSYTLEFKVEAVALSEKIGTIKASKDLQLSTSTLHRWKTELNPNKGIKDPSKPSYESLEKENQRLKKELQYVNEINRVLKKSTAIFSNNLLEVLK